MMTKEDYAAAKKLAIKYAISYQYSSNELQAVLAKNGYNLCITTIRKYMRKEGIRLPMKRQGKPNKAKKRALELHHEKFSVRAIHKILKVEFKEKAPKTHKTIQAWAREDRGKKPLRLDNNGSDDITDWIKKFDKLVDDKNAAPGVTDLLLKWVGSNVKKNLNISSDPVREPLTIYRSKRKNKAA